MDRLSSILAHSHSSLNVTRIWEISAIQVNQCYINIRIHHHPHTHPQKKLMELEEETCQFFLSRFKSFKGILTWYRLLLLLMVNPTL